MLTTINPAQHFAYRFITWCTLYAFFGQMLWGSVWTYLPRQTPTAPMAAGAGAESTSLWRLLGDLLVSPAHAESDTIRATISADDDVSADGVYAPAPKNEEIQPEEDARSADPVTEDSEAPLRAQAADSVVVGGGSGSVNSVMGAYGYSYPITVPPGRGGLAPELSLTYSSMGGNGWLGLGWNLSIGSISRSTKGGKPAYTDDDTFVITLKGTSIALVREGAEYRLKDEGLFLRIRRQGNGWEVTDKGGTRYLFGGTELSRQRGPDGIFKWCLDRIEDPNGNQVEFFYEIDEANHQIYLSEIRYDVGNSVVFESEVFTDPPHERPDAAPSYATYFKVRTVRRLKQIKVFHGGQEAANLIRRYQLDYSEIAFTRQSMLESITHFGSDGTALPATKFEPTACQSFLLDGFERTDPGIPETGNARFHLGDFTGDGRTDYLLTPKGDGEDYWKLYRSVGTGFELAAEGTGMTKDSKITVSDVNDDGRADMLVYPGNQYGEEVPLSLHLSTPDGFAPPTEALTFQHAIDLGNSLYVGDFNGDGRSDLLTRFEKRIPPASIEEEEDTIVGWRVHHYTDEGFVQVQEESATGDRYLPSNLKYHRVVLGDFNGDGKTDMIMKPDLLVTNTDRSVHWGLYISTGQQLELVRQAPYGSHESPMRYDRIFAGDYNGDGMTDLFLTGSSAGSSNWPGYKLMLSTGTDFVLSQHHSPIPGEGWNSAPIYPGDYNGDGRTDLIVEPTTSRVRALYLSTGNGFQRNGSAAPRDGNKVHLGDFNGDGRTDYLVCPDRPDQEASELYLAKIWPHTQLEQSLPNLLGKITNMLGATTTIRYRPSSMWPKDVDEDGVYRSMPIVLPTASAVITLNKTGLPQSYQHINYFSYEGGLYDLQEDEFRGFAKVTVQNPYTEARVKNYYHQDPRFQGRVKESITYSIGLPTILNPYPAVRTVNTWDAHVYNSDEANERTFAFVRTNTITNYDDENQPLTTVTTTYAYDAFGNMTEEDKQEENHRTGESNTLFTRSHYYQDQDHWIMDKPAWIRMGVSDPGPPESGHIGLEISETTMSYFETRPWLVQTTTKRVWQEQDGELVEDEITFHFDYDDYGNPTWASNPRNSAWGTTTDYAESQGMFPNRVVNALGHTLRQEFDGRYGVVTVSTRYAEGSDQQTTRTRYDEFGRPHEIIHPDGSTKTYHYHLETDSRALDKFHHLRVEATLMPTVTTYFDNLDRVVKTVVDDGQRQIVTETVFDNKGRLWKQSLPYEAGETPEYTVNKFDRRGRLRLRTLPDGTTRRIDPDGFTQTLTDADGHQRVITKDSLGRLARIEEATGGVTEYDYDPFGNLMWIRGPMGNETSLVYDNEGRKTHMDDPYMGSWDYRYDAAGNLVWQRDGEGRIIELTYDALNRLSTKEFKASGRRVAYFYDEELGDDGFFNKGALTRVVATEPDGSTSTIHYNYDLMGRLVDEAHTIDGLSYPIGRSYDQAGRPDTVTYPGGITVDYDYDTMGHLFEVYTVDGQGRTRLARYEDHNALGQVGRLTYGNGTITQYTYWAGNHRLKTLMTTGLTAPNTPGILQDLSYNFDGRGNVETITDQAGQTDYAFGYDSLSRLTWATATSASDPDRAYDQVYTYDLAGNMTKKTGKAGFEVLTWEDEATHLRPASVLYDIETEGIGDREVIYNQEMKPTSITYAGQRTTHLAYDGEGNRIKKTADGQITIYVGGAYEVRGGEAVVHVFAGGQRIATIQGGRPFYTHGDHLGSTSLVTDDRGLPVEAIGYLPFGLTLFRKTFNEGTWNSVYRFTGQEFDAEFELYNYNARLYDPVMGRFITADTMVPDWTDPQSLNRYSYCLNNPLKYVDPTGHGFEWGALLVAAVWGMLIGGAVGGLMALRNGGNVWEGFSRGAISGAVSGAMFYCAGAFIRGEMFSTLTVTSDAGKAAVHIVNGAGSGVVNAAISGGDVGQGALVGALSAGMAKGLGGLNNLGFAGRVGIGSVTGGVTSVVQGGDFTEGAIQGAWNSAIADICNRNGKKALRVFRNAMDLGRSMQASHNTRHSGPTPSFSEHFGGGFIKFMGWLESTTQNVLEFIFDGAAERTDAYMYSEHVTQQLETFSNIALASPLDIFGLSPGNLVIDQLGLSTGDIVVDQSYGPVAEVMLKRLGRVGYIMK